MLIEFESPLIVRQELEKAFKVSPATIYRWIKEGNFPAPIRLGANMVRWDRKSVEAWMTEREGA
jgi:prophage regulatory protein